MARKQWTARKTVIVGAGAVGSTFAYSLAQSGVADEIALIDLNRELAEGQVLDLAHGLPFFPTVDIHVGSPEDYADAQVIVITAGAKQRQGESRLNLLQRNVSIVGSIVDDIVAHDSPATILMVSNPVDILTFAAYERSNRPRGHVIGSGTVLDSSRLRYMLSQHCGVDVHNVHAYMLGEHGDSEFAAWSMAHLGGIAITAYCPTCNKCGTWEEERTRIEQAVRDSAYHIIDYKGATFYAVGLALVRITGAILRNEHSVLTVSTMLDGEYGLHGVSLSVPCIVAEEGVAQVLETELWPQEQQALIRSADVIRSALAELRAAS